MEYVKTTYKEKEPNRARYALYGKRLLKVCDDVREEELFTSTDILEVLKELVSHIEFHKKCGESIEMTDGFGFIAESTEHVYIYHVGIKNKTNIVSW